MNVVDASVLVEYLAAGEQVEAAREAIRRERWVWAFSGLRTEVELIGEG